MPIFRRKLFINSEGWGRDPARPQLLRVVLNVPGVLIRALQGSCCLPRSPGTGGVPAGRVGTGRVTAARQTGSSQAVDLPRPESAGTVHSCRCGPLSPSKGRCQASRLRPPRRVPPGKGREPFKKTCEILKEGRGASDLLEPAVQRFSEDLPCVCTAPSSNWTPRLEGLPR